MFHTSTSKKTILYRLYSTPVKISEKSALDLKRLTHLVDLDIPSKTIIHYQISSSFTLFSIIVTFYDFVASFLVPKKKNQCPNYHQNGYIISGTSRNEIDVLLFVVIITLEELCGEQRHRKIMILIFGLASFLQTSH